MPNLKLKKDQRAYWLNVFKDKHLAIFIALIFAVALNYVTFSYILKDRESAQAFDAAFASTLFNNLTGSGIRIGSTGVLVADFIFPGEFGDSSFLAGGGCDFSLGNPCIPFIDADGPATFSQGADDDGLVYATEMLAKTTRTGDAFFKNSDHVCADTLDPSVVEDIYIDGGDGFGGFDCIPLNGGVDRGILDRSSDGWGPGPYTNVSTGGGTTPYQYLWVHSENVKNDAHYNYYLDANIYYENTGLCGSAGGPWDPNFDPMWMEIDDNGAYTPGVDKIIWDNGGCIATGPCVNGCVGAGPIGPAKPIFYDGGGVCAGTAGDGIWQNTEPLWDDIDQDGFYNPANDNAVYDPTACLVGGETGVLMNSNPEAFTESIWVWIVAVDNVLAEGTYWDDAYLGQWLGDSFAAWPVNATYYDSDSDGNFGGLGANAQGTSGDEPVMIDKDLDGMYTSSADFLIDVDGTGPFSLNDDVIADGATLTPLATVDSVCSNTFSGPIIIYVDGSDFADDGLNNGSAYDCVPGNGGTDTLIRDDTSDPLGIAGIIAKLGSSPYTFVPAIGTYVYYDADSSNTWTWGAGTNLTETLILELQGMMQYNLNIDRAFEADGTGSVAGRGVAPNIDDDVPLQGLVNGTQLTYLNSTDNICFSLALGGVGIEDIYADGSDFADDGLNNGSADDCIPGNTGADTILMDVSSPDGLNPATVFSGTWASGAGAFAYFEHLAPNNAYTYGATAALTETLWLENGSSATYSSGADEDVASTGVVLLPGDTLTDLSRATGPNGSPLGFVDVDTNGIASINDTIVEDIGFIQAPAPNGKIDRIEALVDNLMFKNAGTATNSDITALKIYDEGGLFGNGICDNPVGSIDDQLRGTLTWNAALHGWELGKTVSGASSVSQAIVGMCISADISSVAGGGKTIRLQMPQLVDTNLNGLYDVGDEGLFVYSAFDSVVGGSYTVPYTFTILPTPSSGGGGIGDDTIPPANPSNVSITAKADGTVTITWQDPSDSDLSKIVIDETMANGLVAGAASTFYLDKGIQILVLTGRLVGKEYTYKLRAQDMSGNLSSAMTLKITIPSQGEVSTLPGAGEVQPTPLPLEIILPAGLEVGDVIKSSDISSVYYVASDGKRHVFPNEKIFSSWFKDFSKLKIVSSNVLSSLPMGPNMTLRSGTYLMKITTDPKVYAIEPNGVIRWVTTEQIARNLFGSGWNTKIVDMSDVFFVNYTRGSDITTIDYPTGSLLQYQGSVENFYIDNLKKRLITLESFVGNLFNMDFVIKNVSQTNFNYQLGEILPIYKDIFLMK